MYGWRVWHHRSIKWDSLGLLGLKVKWSLWLSYRIWCIATCCCCPGIMWSLGHTAENSSFLAWNQCFSELENWVNLFLNAPTKSECTKLYWSIWVKVGHLSLIWCGWGCVNCACLLVVPWLGKVFWDRKGVLHPSTLCHFHRKDLHRSYFNIITFHNSMKMDYQSQIGR